MPMVTDKNKILWRLLTFFSFREVRTAIRSWQAVKW